MVLLGRALWSGPNNHCQGSGLIGALHTAFMWLA
jgi:hypothetical protein